MRPPVPPAPQPWCCAPTAAWRTPLDRKKTVMLPFLRPGHPPRDVPTMTSAKYPVASFTDSRLQVQVPLGRCLGSGGGHCWGDNVMMSLQWH